MSRRDGWMSGRWQVVMIASLAGLLLVGCEPNWKDPAQVSEVLKTGETKQREKALGKLDTLPEAKQKEAVEGLMAVYRAGGELQGEAMARLVDLEVPAAEEAYLEEFRTDATGRANAALSLLVELEATGVLPQLITTFEETDDAELQRRILGLFVKLPDPKTVPMLQALLADDEASAHQQTLGCRALGQVAREHGGAIDEPVVRTLLRAMLRGILTARTDWSVQYRRKCGLAVQQIGPAAVPHLLAMFRSEFEPVETLERRHNQAPDWESPGNYAKWEAAELLAQMRAEGAVEAFLEDLEGAKRPPEGLEEGHAKAWRRQEEQATTGVIEGLGTLGDQRARPMLEAIVAGQKDEAWQGLSSNGPMALGAARARQFRIDAAEALVKLGDRASLEVVRRVARRGEVAALQEQFDKVGQKGRTISPVNRRFLRWNVARSWAMLAGAGELEGYRSSVVAGAGDENLKAKFTRLVPAFELAETCGAESSPEAKAGCYAERLTHQSRLLQKKAAWELTRLPADTVGSMLVDKLAVDLPSSDAYNAYRSVRRILRFGIYRHPTEAAIAEIDDILDDEKGAVGFKNDHHQMRMLRAWLSHSTKTGE